jgi:hypothetical protein
VGRPSFTPEIDELYERWLGPNSICEYLPEHPIVRVHGGQISYTSFVWDRTERGFNSDIAVTGDDGLSIWALALAAGAGLGPYEPIRETRTVPLRTPLTDEIRVLLRASGAVLIED